MIEVSVKYVDGVQFLDKVKIKPPYEYRNGVRVELVSGKMADYPLIKKTLKSLGLKKVDRELRRRVDIYASYPVNFIRYKVIMFLWRCYWVTVWWLYDNARMFKQIPEAQVFSWRYFTPYVWWVSLKGKLKTVLKRAILKIRK